MKTAILVIDMLNDYFQKGRLSDNRTTLCHSINELANWGRDSDFHIIWVRQEFKKDLSDAFLIMRKKNISKTIENTEGSEILDELIRNKNDY
ncbi:MAG: isochorismatase family protein, partial [Bacteroidota bacterium]